MNRYEFSVVSVCMALHGYDCGSDVGLAADERTRLRDWLRWRVESWTPTPPTRFADVDEAVFQLARAVLAQCDDVDRSMP